MDDPWFPAKTYGWGWGPPNTWQGWGVLGVYLALVLVSALGLAGAARIGAFVGLTLVLNLVCWLTGERPSWRWGSGK